MPGPWLSAPLLTARWVDLVLLNWTVHPSLVLPLMPPGTELDLWHGAPVVSLVGFRFLDTRVLGVPLIGHRTMHEVNLRFYVRRRHEDGSVRRGVVFVRECIAYPLVTMAARLLYQEPYVTTPVEHQVDGAGLAYRWKVHGGWCEARGRQGEVADPTEAAFITDRPWGYTALASGRTAEYHVYHTSWRVRRLEDAAASGDTAPLYGRGLATVLATPPRSAFVADGSAVRVYPRRIMPFPGTLP